jgi:hypothetical protein
MTMPYVPAQAPVGYRQMGGGYMDAIAQRGQPQQQPQMPSQVAPQQPQYPQYQQQQTQLGQPSQVAPMPGPVYVDPAWSPPPSINDPRFQQARQPQVAPAPAPVPQQDYLSIPLNDARLPAHLRGRSVGDIIQIAEGLRQVHLNAAPAPQAPVAQAPVAQPQAAPGAEAPFDWRQPRASIAQVVSDVIDQKLMPRLQPALNQVQNNGVATAEAVVARELGATYEDIKPLVYQQLRGVTDAALLSNPDTWRMVSKQVIGDLWMRSRQGQAPVAQQPQQPQQNQWLVPQQAAVAAPQPVPNLNGFFSEAPNQGGPSAVGVSLSPQQDAARAAMGMSREDYIAWGGGTRGAQ